MVSWDEAASFCTALSAIPAENTAGRAYRLPTEAEWEYACRAGTTTPFHYGARLEGHQANRYMVLGRTTDVGSYPANGFGLHDMHGNVTEWCQDWYDSNYYINAPSNDPSGPLVGTLRSARGGGWGWVITDCRSAVRGGHAPSLQRGDFGFRVALDSWESSDAAAIGKSAVPDAVPPPSGQTVPSDPQQTTTITDAEVADGWQSLFDGLTLRGWHATGSGQWRVKDRVIVGSKVGSSQGQGQLISDSEFGDFAMRLKFKLIAGNSGIFFRGREGGRYGFFGPQVDLISPENVGGLVELRQQDEWAITRIASPVNASQRFFRPNDWNDLVLYAKGGHVSVHINGVPTAELDDEVVYTNGRLAIQMFGNKDTEVFVTDIKIRPEPPVKDTQVQRSAEPQSSDLGQSAPSMPTSKPPRWLGYFQGFEPGSGLSTENIGEVADHTNLLVLAYSDAIDQKTIEACRQKGLKLLLNVRGRDAMDQFVASGISFANQNPDVIMGVLSFVPNYGIPSSEIGQFTRNVKRSAPDLECWIALSEIGNDALSYSIPDDVDVLVVEVMDCSTVDETERRIREVWPMWVAKAGKRPIVVLWNAWEAEGPGLVPRCEKGTIGTVCLAADRLNLDGVLLGCYGDVVWKGNTDCWRLQPPRTGLPNQDCCDGLGHPTS